MTILQNTVEPKYIITYPSNIGESLRFDNQIKYYKRKSSAQKRLDNEIKKSEINYICNFTGEVIYLYGYSEEARVKLLTAEVMEVEVQVKIKVK